MCLNNTNPNNSPDLLAVLASRKPISAEKPTTVSAKATTRTSASVASVARPNLDALSQLSEKQLALMVTVLRCQKQAQ